MAEISIILPQFGRSDLTIRCVESLLEHHRIPIQIILVDDGSEKSELQAVQSRQFPGTELVRNSTNRGVTYSWNRGAEFARGSYLIFLNNDVETTGNWCDPLIAPLRQRSCLLSGPKLRVEPSVPQALESRCPTSQLLEGWCLAISKEEFLSAGGFDERYRLYFSDTDFQLRLLQQSQFSSDAISEVSGLPMAHLGHRTTREQLNRSSLWRRDRNAFHKKWFEAS